MSKTGKVTLKNLLVYQFMMSKVIKGGVNPNVKEIYRQHKQAIADQFGIGGYQTFNFHVRKVMDWQAAGNKVEYIRMDNGGVGNDRQGE